MRPQVLQTGAVSGRTRGLTALALVLLAGGLRVLTQLRSDAPPPPVPVSLREFLTSPDWLWVDPPLPGLILALSEVLNRQWLFLLVVELVATAIVVVMLLRLGERWLDFDAAVLAAGIFALAAPAVAVFEVPGVEGWQAALAILVAGAMLRTARRRNPKLGFRLGVYAGLLTLFSGGGLLWAIASIVWLPMTSHRFRGRGFALMAAMIAAGWVVAVTPVVIRNAVVSEGEPSLPVVGELARMHAAAGSGTVIAPPLSVPADSTDVRRPVSVRYVDRVLADDAPRSEWGRSQVLLARTFEVAGRDGAAGWRDAGRRLVATVGGWTPPQRYDVLAIPWWAVVLLAWCGVVALLPALRQLFPLALGATIPLLQGMTMGVDAGTLLVASPFVCLYAGYALWRIWTGRRWALTWIVVPLVLLVALGVHLAVRGWV